jgi:hypothetical protein
VACFVSRQPDSANREHPAADPIGRISYAMELDHGLELYRISCPLGVVSGAPQFVVHARQILTEIFLPRGRHLFSRWCRAATEAATPRATRS